MVQQRLQFLDRQRLQNKHFASAQQRRIYLKRGVFRRCANQDDAPFFHKWQKRILLRLVKTVDFVNKQNGLFPQHSAVIRLRHHLFNLLDAAGHRAKVYKTSLRPFRDDARQCRFAYTGRAPKDHRTDLILLDQLPQYFSFPQ